MLSFKSFIRDCTKILYEKEIEKHSLDEYQSSVNIFLCLNKSEKNTFEAQKMIFRNSKTITNFIRTFCYILLFFFRILRLNFSLLPYYFFGGTK